MTMDQGYDRPIRVGVIGLGIGRAHITGYQKLHNVKIEAVCDIDINRVHEVAYQVGAPQTYTDYHELIEKSGVDAISVCTPNYLHADAVLACLAAGKHVICEKPLSDTIDGAKTIVHAAEQARMRGQLFMLAMNNRFRGDAQVLKRIIENGELGEIYHAKAGWTRRNGIPGFGGWFTNRSLSGGGPLIDIGIHVLDLALHLMGYPQPVSASGVTHSMFGRRGRGSTGSENSDGSSFDVEDFATGLIKFENGASLSLEASWASHINHDHFYCSLLGSEGGADLEPLTLYKSVDGNPVDYHPHNDFTVSHDAEIAYFIHCVRTGEQPISTAEQGLTVLRILDAIYKSAETGHEVFIDKSNQVRVQRSPAAHVKPDVAEAGSTQF